MKKKLLSIAILGVLSISAQNDFATNAELGGNLQVNNGKGFELNFNTFEGRNQAGINEIGHYDTFSKENAQYSFDSYQHDSNGYLKVSFEDHKNDSSKHLNFGANRLPVGNGGQAQSGTDGVNMIDNPRIYAKVRATTPVSIILTASSNIDDKWITHDGFLTSHYIPGDTTWMIVEFQVPDTSWNGKGDLSNVIGWELYIKSGYELLKGEVHFDWISFGDTDLGLNTSICHDTIYTTITDTNFVTIIDTNLLTVIDTSLITVIDTNYVTINDTFLVAVDDTLIINLSLLTPSFENNILKVYPNPANDYIIVDNGDFNLMSNYTLKIVNTLGAEVFNSFVSIPQFQIPTSILGESGIYYIQIMDDENNLLKTKKLILN